jgi:ubiquinone/menaquinone biosynthesis C-methylase UbiE
MTTATGDPTVSFDADHIASFWQTHPCGSDHVAPREWREFFAAYDRFKGQTEPHIREEIAALNVRGAKVLEVGLGQGTEAQQLMLAGAIYTGVDLTEESVRRVRLRSELFGLSYDRVEVMNAEALKLPDASFDLVFSHGVIHHSPRIESIVAEFHRVLKPGGRAVVMVYHRHSINYWLSIAIVRRLGLFLLMIPGVLHLAASATGEPPARLRKHLQNMRQEGLGYLRLRRFIHKATDGPDNVYSAAFSRREVERLFGRFRHVETRTHLLNERHLPIIRSLLPVAVKQRLASAFGWHLWVIATR